MLYLERILHHLKYIKHWLYWGKTTWNCNWLKRFLNHQQYQVWFGMWWNPATKLFEPEIFSLVQIFFWDLHFSIPTWMIVWYRHGFFVARKSCLIHVCAIWSKNLSKTSIWVSFMATSHDIVPRKLPLNSHEISLEIQTKVDTFLNGKHGGSFLPNW